MSLFNKNKKSNNYDEANSVKIYMIAIDMHLFLNRKEDMEWFSRHTKCAGMTPRKSKMLLGYLTTEKQSEAYSLAKERYGERLVSLITDIALVHKDLVDYSNAQ